MLHRICFTCWIGEIYQQILKGSYKILYILLSGGSMTGYVFLILLPIFSKCTTVGNLIGIEV